MPSTNPQLPPLEIPSGTLPGVADALRHWHEHRPKMYTDLHSSGRLLSTAIAAYDATIEDQDKVQAGLEKQGHNASTAFVMAKQVVRERYIYLPTEEDVPELMTSPDGIPFYLSENPN